ncbi:MAG: hypothetical protein A2937_00100 [Candidatus Yonathbacteria bacterium RIFCSPLOWO2_01_FULL_47_33b]|uniref:2'-deoxycytidine 5'-triphosphate deaminase n=1 Tax=Candidatus Yonathbacteria bacterium RIFCSPLOWO2_01_FULL_47_33b TaxID=1802727 RepID=A0A1G2SEK6_9BACT|nr:MAG: hypothetical protein A2937_00100 [Candidatus Yonathbacteria bacterium RIFCSPLOWO2_01_FULL_47_33b]
MSKNLGALPDSLLQDLVDAGFIKGASSRNIGPASLDLCISDEVYRVNGMFQPRIGETIRSLIERLDARQHVVGAPFEREVVYLARLNESLTLPQGVYGYCNPKSSTGRHDVHVRVLADGVPRYDAVTPTGFLGELWAVIISRSYPVIIPTGEPLSQLRLFNANTRLSEEEIEIAFSRWKLLHTLSGEELSYGDVQIRDDDGSIILTLDLDSAVAGYEYTGRQRILDFSQGKKAYDAEDFFEPINVCGERIYLRRGGFYILSTAEAVRVPPCLACEMVPMDERSGEFRSHYAGFIDPGWGYGKDGEGKGRPLTLEVRPFEDLVIFKNHPIAKIKFEQMTKPPILHYDEKAECNYGNQSGPKLAKHFK